MSLKKSSQVMSTDLITIKAGTDLKTAYGLLQKHRIRHLPVLDDAGSIVGIISDRDIIRAARSQLEGIGEEGCPTETVDFDPSSTVRDYMSWPVRSFASSASVAAVATAMIREKVSAFLITEGGTSKTVGIVTTEDCLKLLVELLHEDGRPRRNLDLASLFRESGGSYVF